MRRVKIFTRECKHENRTSYATYSATASELEDEVNRWLAENKKTAFSISVSPIIGAALILTLIYED
ncbi:MAG: hypothetical protein LBN30_02640 [Oscillospiraceae bacterium]|jgi:hypothetical protein|nr:hypothetical protein [Oscillospiraceae bacterium]